jgi:ABC-type spermidine/putrescine transport system permease subunit I
MLLTPFAYLMQDGPPLDVRRIVARCVPLAPATAIWLCLFAIPLAIFIVYGFFRTGILDIEYVFSLDAYRRVLTDRLYLDVILRTMEIAMTVAVIASVTAFIFCYFATFHFRRYREIFLTIITVSLFSGYLVRVYAWRTILGTEGIVNKTLLELRVVDHPLSFLVYSQFGVILVLICMLLPFAIIPMYSALGNVSRELLDASRDLGAGPIEAIRTVLIPIAHKGIVAGFAFAFVLAGGDYVTPQLVGGASTQMVGNIIADQFGASFDWPLASAIGVVTTFIAGGALFLVSILLKRITK